MKRYTKIKLNEILAAGTKVRIVDNMHNITSESRLYISGSMRRDYHGEYTINKTVNSTFGSRFTLKEDIQNWLWCSSCLVKVVKEGRYITKPKFKVGDKVILKEQPTHRNKSFKLVELVTDVKQMATGGFGIQTNETLWWSVDESKYKLFKDVSLILSFQGRENKSRVKVSELTNENLDKEINWVKDVKANKIFGRTKKSWIRIFRQEKNRRIAKNLSRTC